MRAIWIDAERQQVEEVDIKGDLDSIKNLLKDAHIELAFYLHNGDHLYVEGLLKHPVKFGFSWMGAPQHFYAGNGVLLGGWGPDEEDVRTRLIVAKSHVTWHKFE